MILNNNTLAIPNGLKSKDESSLSKTVQFVMPKNIKPAFEFKLLKENQEYENIEIVKWIDGKPNKEFNKIILHPIETIHSIEFANKNKKEIRSGFQFQHISRVRIIDDVKKSFLHEKKDKLLGLTLTDGRAELEIIVNVEDKEADIILKDIEAIRNIDTANYWEPFKLPYENNDGSIIYAEIFPKTPYLAENEVLLWFRTETKGVLHRNLIWIEAITNFRVFQYNFENHLANYIILTSLDDVAVTNRYRASTGTRTGAFTGTRYRSMGGGVYSSTGNSTSTSIGNVVFMYNGKPLMQFNQVSDPSGVTKLVQSAKKHLLGLEKILMKEEKKNDVIQIERIESNLCPDCKFNNPISSKFCGQCGTKLNDLV